MHIVNENTNLVKLLPTTPAASNSEIVYEEECSEWRKPLTPIAVVLLFVCVVTSITTYGITLFTKHDPSITDTTLIKIDDGIATGYTKSNKQTFIPSSRFILSGVRPNHPNDEYCLEINGSNSSSVREKGTVVDVWRCDKVETFNDFPDRPLIDFWYVDRGVLVSGLSGLCLVRPNYKFLDNMQQDTCKEEYAFTFDKVSGQIQVKGNATLCLLPNLDNKDQQYGIDGFALSINKCITNGPKWRTEANDLVVYPPPEGDWHQYASPFYKATVKSKSSGREFPSYMYVSKADDYQSNYNVSEFKNYSNSYTSLSYNTKTGPVTVRIEKLDGTYKDVVIRPNGSVKNIQKISDTIISFEIDMPYLKLSVEFDGHIHNSCFIFADELENDIPSMFDPNVLYYGIGYHSIKEKFPQLTGGKQFYIAGGAFVVSDKNETMIGTLNDNTDQVKILGRGIISGKLSPHYTHPVKLCGNNIVVDGITLVDSPQQSFLGVNEAWYCKGSWNMSVQNSVIRNVKIMGWTLADGISAGKNGHVSKSFIRVNDDGVKPFYSGSLFEDLTIWQMKNGWAIMLSWNTEGTQSGITIRNINIIHDEHESDFPVSGCDKKRADGYGCKPSQATIGAVQGKSGILTNILIENIVAETSVYRPIFLGIQTSHWGKSGDGFIQNVTFKNVKFNGGGYKGKIPSIILGGPESYTQIKDISFIDLSYYGTPPESSLNDAEIILLGNTDRVTIKVS